MERTRYIFTSDVHLGAESGAGSESEFVQFLQNLPADTAALYLLGDIFDFWFEKRGRKMGFESALEAIREMVESGVEVYFLQGNHDWWTFGGLERATGLKVLSPQPVLLTIAGRRFCLAHGDGLGKIGFKERAIQKFLKGRVSVALARALVPTSWIYALARVWSRSSRRSNSVHPYVFTEESPLYRFACACEAQRPVDCFIFGHIHRKIEMDTPSGARLYLLDDWSRGANWLEFDGLAITRRSAGKEAEPQETTTTETHHEQGHGSVAGHHDQKNTRAGITAPMYTLRGAGGAGIGDMGNIKTLAFLAEALSLGRIVISDLIDRSINLPSAEPLLSGSDLSLPVNPVYMDLRSLGHLMNRPKEAAYRNSAAELDKQSEIDYIKVHNIKMHLLHEKFLQDGAEVLGTDAYYSFWRRNKQWLERYSAYCTLRHKYGTGNNRYWSEPDYTSLLGDEHFINEYSEDLRFHCYVQFLLHSQLREAYEFAAGKGVALEIAAPGAATAEPLQLRWQRLGEEQRRNYYNGILGIEGEPPSELESWVAEAILAKELQQNPSAVLPLADWTSVTALACYNSHPRPVAGSGGSDLRMDIALEDLLQHKALLDCIRHITK